MEETLQPYEILATDAIGNPTFIDFISTKVKSDEKSVYEFLKTVYGFDENTTFVEIKFKSNNLLSTIIWVSIMALTKILMFYLTQSSLLVFISLKE